MNSRHNYKQLSIENKIVIKARFLIDDYVRISYTITKLALYRYEYTIQLYRYTVYYTVHTLYTIYTPMVLSRINNGISSPNFI